MTFDTFVLGVGQRVLSPRTFDLIVSPALADAQYDREQRRGPWRAYLPVLIALAAGMRIDVARQSGMFLFLTLVPACYSIALLTICGDFFKQTAGLLTVGVIISVFSFTPVMMCFLPDWGRPRSSSR
jgi:hypothetical protein